LLRHSGSKTGADPNGGEEGDLNEEVVVMHYIDVSTFRDF